MRQKQKLKKGPPGKASFGLETAMAKTLASTRRAWGIQISWGRGEGKPPAQGGERDYTGQEGLGKVRRSRRDCETCPDAVRAYAREKKINFKKTTKKEKDRGRTGAKRKGRNKIETCEVKEPRRASKGGKIKMNRTEEALNTSRTHNVVACRHALHKRPVLLKEARRFKKDTSRRGETTGPWKWNEDPRHRQRPQTTYGGRRGYISTPPRGGGLREGKVKKKRAVWENPMEEKKTRGPQVRRQWSRDLKCPG